MYASLCLGTKKVSVVHITRCPYHPDDRISGLSKKNVEDTCCIVIKAMADKEEEG